MLNLLKDNLSFIVVNNLYGSKCGIFSYDLSTTKNYSVVINDRRRMLVSNLITSSVKFIKRSTS